MVQGERVSDEIKRSLLELRDGNDKVAIPNNARVEVTLDTSAKADSKTAVASVVLKENNSFDEYKLSCITDLPNSSYSI